MDISTVTKFCTQTIPLFAIVLSVAVSKPHVAQAEDLDQANAIKTGYLLDVPVPLSSQSANHLIGQLTRLSESAPQGQRITVVLKYGENIDAGDETPFEDALRLARAMTSTQLRQVRIASLVQGEVNGHSTLPILASDLLLVGPRGVITDATAGETAADETIRLTYRAIAEKRGLFPTPIAEALVDSGLELVRVSKVGGEQVFATGKELKEIRGSGKIVSEDLWSAKGVPLRMDAKTLRTARIAAAAVTSIDEAAERLDLAELSPVADQPIVGEAAAVMLEISGSIAPGRTRRWQSNLTSTLRSGEINTWLISIDSIGGNLDDSATLAGWFSEPDLPLHTVAGLVRGEARGDSALIAIACKPLFMKPESRMGGLGADAISPESLRRYDELIDDIALSTKRPAALIRGLLNTELEVYRFTNRKTGRVRYATEQDLIENAEDIDAEREKWERGERIELADGLSANDAIALGLADGESPSLEDTSRRIGLGSVPPPVSDRGLVRFVERLGRNGTLSFLLLFIGFMALSAEANAPGLSVPGFIALVCFGLFFWMKFLAGTAEWLELVALSLGLICIAIEIFVLPGFGIFGIGGLALTVLGVVLMSQTFVLPRNVYQVTLLTRGLWAAVGGAGGLIGGFLLMRILFPHVPLLRGLVMEPPDEDRIDQQEKLGDFSLLMGCHGVATTPLRPSGKARFGDQVVQVVSDGTSIASGDPIRVCEVHATKVVVEAIEN